MLDKKWIILFKYYSINVLIGCGGVGADDCCTVGVKCYEGEGDCDYDEDCMPGLRCGVNNCRVKSGYEWHKDTDCCYKPSKDNT